MALSKRDREFRLPKISYLDFKQLEMDRVLTAFFARLAHNGFPSRLRRKAELTTEALVAVDERLATIELGPTETNPAGRECPRTLRCAC